VAVGALALTATLLTACGATPQPPAAQTTPTATAPTAPTGPAPTSNPPDPNTDWTTYHHDNARTGVGSLSPLDPRTGPLRIAWQANLDGSVYGQPLAVGDTILAATENDTVYALNADTGAVRWSAHLGTPVPRSALPCGDIDPLGITSTMVYDPATGLVFALAETTGGAHTLFGVDTKTGKVVVTAAVEPPTGDRLAHQQRSALTLLNGRIYVAYGGLYGDCGNYVGSVVSVTTAGTNPQHYAVPTAREGGIWAPGGAVVSNNTLFYSAGNGAASRGTNDGSDSVIALSPTLRRTDVFAPVSWQQDNADDLDLGSGGPAVLGQWVLRPASGESATSCRRAGSAGSAGRSARWMCAGRSAAMPSSTE